LLKLLGSMTAVMAAALMVHGGGPAQASAYDRSQETNICGVDICTSNFQCITACGARHCVIE
jgi:hypothetical protein